MSVRVIAGSRRSRVLRVPEGHATRPTAARVREAVFSMLGSIEGFTVLDLYAGSGALGIEALSRGAEAAVFVERDRSALACIRQNLQALALTEHARILPLDVEAALRKLGPESHFDVVFADPPWAELDGAVRAMREVQRLLRPDGRVVLEHPKHAAPDLHQLHAYDRRTWGDTSVAFFERPASAL